MNKIQSDNLSNKGRGRPKGSQNATTKAAKDAIELAAQKLGGGERLYEWALEDPVNEKVFWSTIYPKLLPVQVHGDAQNPLQMINKVVFEVVNAEG